MTTFYFDPIVDVHHRLPVAAALTTAYYAAPQFPDDARRLFEAGCAGAGFGTDREGPVRPSRAIGSSLVLAREWEMHDLAAWLVEAAEESYGPTWDEESGEFTWTMGLDEPHPRGQFNAFMAAAEASGPGRWTALSAAPLDSQPQVVDVDFPTVAFRRAEWVAGELRLSLVTVRDDPSRTTMFRIVGVEPRVWDVQAPDGTSVDVTASGVLVRTPLVSGALTFTPGSY